MIEETLFALLDAGEVLLKLETYYVCFLGHIAQV